MKCGKCGKGGCICPFSLGIAVGLASGLFMMGYALLAYWYGIGTSVIEESSTFYHGYAPSWTGALIGGGWGLLEGFIFGFLVALFYNCMSCFRSMCCKKSDESCGTCPPEEKK